MNCPKAALFDLDETLAESFRPPVPEMIEKLRSLLSQTTVAIISGADFERIQREILDALADSPHLSRLWVFPSSASQGYFCENGMWQMAYTHDLSQTERERIERAIADGVEATGMLGASPKYEPKILIDATQVRYATLGLNAAEEDKRNFDPDKSKRTKLKQFLEERLPECEILIGGKTTIDITKRGVDKSYGVRWFSEHLKVPTNEMLYIGDALYEGGNDFVVIQTGIRTIQTSGPKETLGIIDGILADCTA